MEGTRTYISCPMTIDEFYLHHVVNLVKKTGLTPSYWVRGLEYNPKMLENSDIFVLIPPNNEWNISRNKLPLGTRKELERALDLDIPVYHCYNSGDGLKLYKASVYGNSVSAVTGTFTELHKKYNQHLSYKLYVIKNEKLPIKYNNIKETGSIKCQQEFPLERIKLRKQELEESGGPSIVFYRMDIMDFSEHIVDRRVLL